MLGGKQQRDVAEGWQRAAPWIHMLLWLGFFLIVVFSNQLDWDQFFSFFEVDRRAWLVDRQPPLWSYQLCAGSSRVGDPQSFGLSPLFLPILVLGAIWGAKILVLSCSLLGWYSLRRILVLLFPTLSRANAASLAIFFLLGNFFLWHAHAGHLTFSLIPLSLLLIEGCLRLAVADFGWRETAWFTLAGTTIFSAGFYPALVFFLIPLGICLLIPAMVLGFGRWPKGTALLRWCLALGCALTLSAHKWLAVVRYQGLFPRTLDSVRHAPEAAISLGQTVAYQFSPTWNYNFWLAPGSWGPWDVWEYSMCSALSFLALAVGRGKGSGGSSKKPWLFFAIAVLLGLGFMLGESNLLSLHRVLNQVLYAGSVRVLGRYGIVLQVILLVFVAWRLSQEGTRQARAPRFLLPLGFAVTVLNLAMMGRNTDGKATTAVLALPKLAVTEMRVGQVVPLRTVERPKSDPYHVPSSHMYPAIAAGEIVPNCYQPLRRPRTISTERTVFGSPAVVGQRIDLLDTRGGSLPEACIASVYASQNQIHFDAVACPKDFCLNVNAVNQHADAPFAFDEQRGRYCRIR